MGQAKREMEKWQDLGCRPVGPKHVCPACVDDQALKDFITANATATECDYCEGQFAEPTAAEADVVIEHIARSIGYEYEDPVHSVGWDSSEGGYLLPTRDADDLLCNFDLGEFHHDAARALDGLWVEKDPYGDRPWEYMLRSWADFAHHVKHVQRFFFPRASDPEASSIDRPPDASILGRVAEVAEESGLLRTVTSGSTVWRARQHAAGAAPTSGAQLGTPPQEFAVLSNRMSPAGIPQFYAAEDAATAIAETVSPSATKPEVTVGTFVLPTELTLLDLADIPEVPSLFDENKQHLRSGLRFIREFAEQLALPITRDGQEHIEYVPTQMVSEYFRTVFRLPGNRPLDGIRYRSAKRNGGVCVCLFFDNDDFDGEGSRAAMSPRLQSTATHPVDM